MDETVATTKIVCNGILDQTEVLDLFTGEIGMSNYMFNI